MGYLPAIVGVVGSGKWQGMGYLWEVGGGVIGGCMFAIRGGCRCGGAPVVVVVAEWLVLQSITMIMMVNKHGMVVNGVLGESYDSYLSLAKVY